MQGMKIRKVEAQEYDEVARVWMESWASVGLEPASDQLLAELRAHIDREIANGWSLYVADDAGQIAAMLALRLRDGYLDQLFVAPAYHGRGVGKMLLQFTRKNLPDEIWLRCASKNSKAWHWYEREGFVLEKEEPHPVHGLMMRYYRWKKGLNQ
ncbi:GNAT family N-acetyltransferase [Bradyrhizobium sp. LHD-71]|uniref:GNAT family N-acetyltransferase n=1 Tax=Bradyrhizobium sp. LHD-71 TaxID=3072141 RepID=UPI0028106AEB|nr:GNAT family N-acetyltransferase [Bradyrhizobium sp. LHD-71]MDQ8731939.1 GNAT family N-acetyltransferase [Bradyrhizobium sp. LHD-71]